MPECLCRLSPHLGYRLVAELRLHCRFTASVGFFQGHSSRVHSGVGFSGHRSPAAPCTAAIRKQCLPGISWHFLHLMAAGVLPLHGIHGDFFVGD